MAYDVLGGPARLLRDRVLSERIDIAGADMESAVRSLDERALLQSTGERRIQLLVVEEQHSHAVADAHATRASDQDRQRARAYWLAVWGLLLVFAGGAAETVAAVMARGIAR